MERRSFIEHVGWTGLGVAYAMSPRGLFAGRALAESPQGAIDFVQISDSHIGFHQAANPDVGATLKAAVDAINNLPQQPSFVVHTGDITHLSTPAQFATAKDILGTLRAPLIALPGEHDVIGNQLSTYLEAFRIPGSTSDGWASWDNAGTHFVSLINVFNFEKMGLLGSDQLAWLERDLASHPASRPIVVFAHVPLYALFPQWGWTTEDGSKALALLRRFQRVTVLNGHIHQTLRHEDGNIAFASAESTAYPQPKPGVGPKPGPVTLPHDDLLRAIGYRTVHVDAQTGFEDHALG